MNEFLILAMTALWLGVLTSISPCPLATNIAAVSFLGRRVDRPVQALWGGMLYSIGRMLAYVLLAVLVVSGFLAVPALSRFLQKYMIQILGLLLILTGMVLLDMLSFNLPGFGAAGERFQRGGDRWGLLESAGMGFIFALSFCPVSAALYFGSLIPLCLDSRSPVMLPLLYGFGTALPVAVFAVLIAFGVQGVGRAFRHVQALERWARPASGWLFLLIGIYMSLRYIYLT
ncbi:MAG: aromatic aminobenezylarsenical efflux permease ArsG family transporter [Candidatus Sumerlaeia bacterium]